MVKTSLLFKWCLNYALTCNPLFCMYFWGKSEINLTWEKLRIEVTGFSIFVASAAGVIEGIQKLGKTWFFPSCMLLTLDVDGWSPEEKCCFFKNNKKVKILLLEHVPNISLWSTFISLSDCNINYTKDPGATLFILAKIKECIVLDIYFFLFTCINEFLLFYWYIPLKICLALHSKKHESFDFYPDLVKSGTEMNVYNFVSSKIHTNPAAI